MVSSTKPQLDRPFHTDDRGFSLIELLVATLLLAGVVAGFIRVFTPARGFTVTEARLSVERNLDRSMLEDLRQSVRQDTWADAASPLAPGVHNQAAFTLNKDTRATPKPYTRTYTVTNVAGRDYRKVEIRVT